MQDFRTYIQAFIDGLKELPEFSHLVDEENKLIDLKNVKSFDNKNLHFNKHTPKTFFKNLLRMHL